MNLQRRWPLWLLLATLCVGAGSGFVHGRWTRPRDPARAFPAGQPAADKPGGGDRAVPAMAGTRALPSRGGSATPAAPGVAAANASAPGASSPGAAAPPKAQPATGGSATAEYRIKSGDTLGAIALIHGVDLDTLMALNSLSGPDIFPKQVLRLPTGANLRTHTVMVGDTAWDLAQKFGISVAQLAAANGSLNLDLLQIGQSLRLPAGAAAGGAAAADHLLTGQVFRWPVQGPITSVFGPRWGRFHHGIDIAANTGVPIRATQDGVVVTSGWVSGYGNTIILRHGSEVRTLYAHASELLVRVGEGVKAGQVIARVGSTGESTGPHLHFELIAGRPVDPLAHLPVPGS